MHRPARLCEAVGLIVSISEPGRGGAAGFTACHALKLLEAASRGRIGRPMAERLLGLGEASTKTLMRRLRALGLLAAGRGGHYATEAARGLLGVLDHVRCVKIPEHQSIPWRPAAMVATDLLEPPRGLVDVYHVRDYLVLEGCRTAVIAGVDRGLVTAPGVPDEDIPGFREHLAVVASEELVWDRALIIVVPWECRWAACAAILKAFYTRRCRRRGRAGETESTPSSPPD